VARIVLEAHSLSEKDLLPVYLKPVFTQEKMINGELQGFVLMAGVPAEAYTRISHLDLSLVPISPEIAMIISERFPYLVPGEIPADVYRGVPKTPTLQVHALLVVDSASSDDLVYQVTTALWSDRTHTLLKGGHPQGQAIALKTALEGISIPLHPGAQRFYRERDMLSKEAPKQ
jgi:TRAP transporter TAXI family solute receptor